MSSSSSTISVIGLGWELWELWCGMVGLAFFSATPYTGKVRGKMFCLLTRNSHTLKKDTAYIFQTVGKQHHSTIAYLYIIHNQVFSMA